MDKAQKEELKFMLSEEGQKEFKEDIAKISIEELKLAYTNTHLMAVYTLLQYIELKETLEEGQDEIPN